MTQLAIPATLPCALLELGDGGVGEHPDRRLGDARIALGRPSIGSVRASDELDAEREAASR